MSILFKDISILDENFEVRHHCYLGVKADRIVYLASTMPEEAYERVYEGNNRFLMPGLYNSHTHLAMSLLRGYAENMNLQDWLFNHIMPFEATLTSSDIYWGAMLGIAEAIRFGTVGATDMYMDVAANSEAVFATGFKMNTCMMLGVGKEPKIGGEFPYDGAREILQKYHQRNQGALKLDAYIHGEYTTTPEFVEQMAAFAKENQLNIHLHLSETKSEHEECKIRHQGLTPAQYFDSLGVFEVPTTAAHCVWVEPADLEIFQAKGVTVASNPVSNLKLASGICPAPAMLKAGINLALGTDSVASNNNLNLFEEIKLFAMLHKANTGDPTVITTKEAICAATLAGAKAQGREDSGLIKIGNKADLAVLDIDKPYMYPRHDLLSNLVFSAQATDVILTMVDGKILYEGGEYRTIDLEKVLFQVQSITAHHLRCQTASSVVDV